MMAALDAFHFLRPLWLLALIPVAVLWWRIRPRRAAAADQPTGIAPHLAAALQVGDAGTRRVYPIDLVGVLGLGLCLAVAGPSWGRLPNPLIAETAPLVVAMKVTPSMMEADLPPSRLERARFKVLDLVASRSGARTALIAYAGSAHQVAPLTEDPNILRPLLEGLSPDIMPKEGDDPGAALDLATQILAGSETPGTVLFVLDDLAPNAVADLNAAPDGSAPLVFLLAAPQGTKVAQLDQVQGAQVVPLSPDDRDLDQIARLLRSAQQQAELADERLSWEDRGPWLAWPLAFLVALWFRRGWTMRWMAVLLALGLAGQPGTAQADGWRDWFFTPDQQGRLAYDRKDYGRAAELFVDPAWKAQATLMDGQYEEAATLFGAIETPEAALSQGIAQIKSRQYRPAVRSFETALERRPDYPEATRNLEIAKAIVEFVEGLQEQSDSGETTGIGADEIVFDNASGKGETTQIEAPEDDIASPQTADQWMQSIDTQMGDFLKSRFRLDTAGGAE